MKWNRGEIEEKKGYKEKEKQGKSVKCKETQKMTDGQDE